MVVREYTRFLGEMVCHPRDLGAFGPSSANLGRHMVGCVDWTRTSTVVEYGPGTGPITEQIIAQMPSQTTFLAIEINPQFANLLRQRFPGVRICEGSVGDVQIHCAAAGIERVDAIVSGLPWVVFSDEDQTEYLDATMKVLRPGGQFITFGYLQGMLLPSGWRFRRKLKRYFSEVRVSRPVWANFPPAFFYCCKR